MDTKAATNASPTDTDLYGSGAYIRTTPSCPSVTATSSPASPAVHGTGVIVTITAVPVGCTNANPQYEFWMLAQGSTRWQLLRGYSTSATYDWNTSGAPPGTEQFGVWIKDSASSAPYDSYVSMPFTLS